MQLCEGLNVIAGQYHEDLRQFELKKMAEIYKHKVDGEGVIPNVAKFKRAVENWGANVYMEHIGYMPFHFGEKKQYWRQMRDNDMKIFRFEKFVNERDKTCHIKAKDFERMILKKAKN